MSAIILPPSHWQPVSFILLDFIQMYFVILYFNVTLFFSSELQCCVLYCTWVPCCVLYCTVTSHDCQYSIQPARLWLCCDSQGPTRLYCNFTCSLPRFAKFHFLYTIQFKADKIYLKVRNFWYYRICVKAAEMQKDNFFTQARLEPK